MQKANLLYALVFSCLLVACSTEKTTLNYNGLKIVQTRELTKDKVTLPPILLPEKKGGINLSRQTSLAGSKKLVSGYRQHLMLRKSGAVSHDSCDYILLKNGLEIGVKIIKADTTEITYKKCNKSDGRAYTISTSDVSMIKYASGSQKVFSDSRTVPLPAPQNPDDREIETFGLVGLFIGVVGYFVGGAGLALPIICGLIATVCGLVGIARPREKYKQRGFAFVSFIVGAALLLSLLWLAHLGFL